MFQAIFDSPDYRLKFSTTSTRYTKLHEGAVLDKKTRLNALSNGCPAYAIFKTLGLGSQWCCQKSSTVDR